MHRADDQSHPERAEPPPESLPGGETLPDPVARHVGRTLLRCAAAFVLLGLLVAAVLFRSWFVFFMGLVFAFAFMAMIAAPLWLAHSTEVADTEKAPAQGKSREEIDRP